eukprot:15229221-Ditylum_brightwellii.AAC.1
MSISRSATVQSGTHFTAENSLRSAMLFILTTAASHYVPSLESLPDVQAEIADKAKASGSSRFLFNKVDEVHNNRPLFPVRRPYIISTNDTVEFAFKGTDPQSP